MSVKLEKLKKLERCQWVTNDHLYIEYHDNEWGIPKYDELELFELLILESMQSGLSWLTILKKREGYRANFDGFDPQKIALYNEKKVEQLLLNSAIIRNKLKINSIINNAKQYLHLVDEIGSFSDYIWQFVGGVSIKNHWTSIEDVPTHTMLSDKIAHDLKERGFRFIGSKTVYAFMQSSGMVNDHIASCFCSQL